MILLFASLSTGYCETYDCHPRKPRKPVKTRLKIDKLNETDLNITLSETPVRLKPLLTINSGTIPEEATDSVFTARFFSSIGVRKIHTANLFGNFDIYKMYPSASSDPLDSDSYNFSESDKIFRFISDNGFEPLFWLGNSFGRLAIPSLMTERKNLIEACVEVIRHFREGKYNGFRIPFKSVEIWREPDAEEYWPGYFTDFKSFFLTLLKRLQGAFPDIGFGGPGFYVKNPSDRKLNNRIREFLRYLKKNNTKLDFFSWQCFPDHPIDLFKKCRMIESILKSENLQDMKTTLSAWSIPEIGDAGKLSGHFRAAMLTACWAILQDTSVNDAVLLRGTEKEEDFPKKYDLLDSNRSPETLSVAYAFFSLVSECTNRMAISVEPLSTNSPIDSLSAVPLGTTSVQLFRPRETDYINSMKMNEGCKLKPLWMVAAEDRKSGLVRLLIANLGEQSFNCNLMVTKFINSRPTTLKIRELAAESMLIKTQALNEPVFQINPVSIMLVDIEK
ncbi:MAG: hypothetical protein HQM10_25415 [Candidatus Riflebacteria bacterium]|nr:hypothetical protein [Candidatus Riflebacteria bacterium]